MTIGTSAALGTVLSVLERRADSRPHRRRRRRRADARPRRRAGRARSAVRRCGSSPTSPTSRRRRRGTTSSTSWAPSRSPTWAAPPGTSRSALMPWTSTRSGSTYADDPRFKVAFDQVAGGRRRPASVGPMLGPLREVPRRDRPCGRQDHERRRRPDGADEAAAQANALIADYLARNP